LVRSFNYFSLYTYFDLIRIIAFFKKYKAGRLINEKHQILSFYESSQAITNNQIKNNYQKNSLIPPVGYSAISRFPSVDFNDAYFIALAGLSLEYNL